MFEMLNRHSSAFHCAVTYRSRWRENSKNDPGSWLLCLFWLPLLPHRCWGKCKDRAWTLVGWSGSQSVCISCSFSEQFELTVGLQNQSQLPQVPVRQHVGLTREDIDEILEGTIEKNPRQHRCTQHIIWFFPMHCCPIDRRTDGT